MFEFTDTLLQKRRFFIAGIVVTANLLLICLLAPIVQTYHSSIAARVQSSYTNQAPQNIYDSPNAITNALSQVSDDTRNATDTAEVKVLSGTMSLAIEVTHFDKASVHDVQTAITSIIHGIVRCMVDTGHAIGSVFLFIGHTVGDIFTFIGHTIGDIFAFMEHTTGDVFGLFHGVTHLSLNSIIRPQDHTPTPTITQLRAQQAALIQSGTKVVSIATLTKGTGGACDDGNGNGGYPMSWCNAPMDSVATISYSSDPINRECTSYAYWYFTSIEGHTGFQAWGNAKYWATTSNYPTHTSPTVGAIAVETTGAYGHVAIVQALAGQDYDGRVVPAGYVLVSEMNYDWDGHFRYSYSPLSKFSTYIYP